MKHRTLGQTRLLYVRDFMLWCLFLEVSGHKPKDCLPSGENPNNITLPLRCRRTALALWWKLCVCVAVVWFFPVQICADQSTRRLHQPAVLGSGCLVFAVDSFWLRFNVNRNVVFVEAICWSCVCQWSLMLKTIHTRAHTVRISRDTSRQLVFCSCQLCRRVYSIYTRVCVCAVFKLPFWPKIQFLWLIVWHNQVTCACLFFSVLVFCP